MSLYPDLVQDDSLPSNSHIRAAYCPSSLDDEAE
jgi:hypothetical protein